MRCKFLYGNYDFKFRKISPVVNKVDHKEVFLIIYPDGIRKKGKKCLNILQKFAKEYLNDFSTIHLLPFYPYSSDKGFAVVDYKKVAKEFGDWKDIHSLAKNFKLMFDGVIDHTSSKHKWFKKAVAGKKHYKDYYLSFDKKIDTSKVYRPRQRPLLSNYGRYYWTTFSRDQVDLNFRNPKVSEEILRILQFYVINGAKFIRLDAIAYLFDDPLTSSIDLKENHELVNLIYRALPKNVRLVSEVNLGEDIIDHYRKESWVYNFPLPPLVYYSFLTGDVKPLFNHLKDTKEHNFNFLASHDGIGLVPVRNHLNVSQIDKLVKDVESKGFRVTYAKGPYELNINYFDALDKDERKFLCAHSLLLSLKGIPAIYYHSLFGSSGKRIYDKKHPRSINRAALSLNSLEKNLNCNSVQNRIYTGILEMIKIKKKILAFDPYSEQKVRIKDKLIIIQRKKGNSRVTCYHNFGSKKVKIRSKKNLITGEKQTEIPAYGYLWTKDK